MINQKINKKRLEQYAKYLKRGKLHCKKFCSVGEPDKETKEGYETGKLKSLVVLPLMEIPIIFQKEWIYNEDFMPIFIDDPAQDMISSVKIFFGLNTHMFEHLFCPRHQSTEVFGGKVLNQKPAPSEIAENIFSLIESIKHFENIKNFKSVFNLN